MEETFRDVSPVAAGAQAFEIENALKPHQLSAVDALAAMRSGWPIGHTVAVLESQKLQRGDKVTK